MDTKTATAMLACGRLFAAEKPSQSSRSPPAPDVDVADAPPADMEAVPDGDDSSHSSSSHSSSSSSEIPPMPVPVVAVGSAAPDDTAPVGESASGDNASGEIESGEIAGAALVTTVVIVLPSFVTTSVMFTTLETVDAAAVMVEPGAVTVLVIVSPLTTVVTI